MTKFSKTPKLDLMAQEFSSKVKINLSSEGNNSTTNIFFKWAVTGGKIVIIFTELIALGAFFYSFTVDQQIRDLHEQIDREVVILKSQEKQEAQYRNLQDRLKNIQAITSDVNFRIDSMYKIASESSMQQLSVQRLILNKDSITIDGSTPSIFNLSKFLKNLKLKNFVSSITINKVEKSDSGFDFSLDTQIKDKGNK